jgi:uracil-DNA glycosylase
MKELEFENVKVVILGQDPYHGPGQANGLAFAVNADMPRPPTLRNILKELESDLNIEIHPEAKTLVGWAKQGVLLLNTSLTVELGRPGSHANLGWGVVTDSVLKALATRSEPTVFMLWGKTAQAKRQMLGYKHLILEAAHPSPQTVGKFFGCRPFSQANQYLISKGVQPIDWEKIDDHDS